MKTCEHCRAENSATASECLQCGGVFPGSDERSGRKGFGLAIALGGIVTVFLGANAPDGVTFFILLLVGAFLFISGANLFDRGLWQKFNRQSKRSRVDSQIEIPTKSIDVGSLPLEPDWHWADNSKRYGPVSEGQIVQLIKEGKISRETKVWRRGMKKWIRACDSILIEHFQEYDSLSAEIEGQFQPPPIEQVYSEHPIKRFVQRQSESPRLFATRIVLALCFLLVGGFFVFHKVTEPHRKALEIQRVKQLEKEEIEYWNSQRRMEGYEAGKKYAQMNHVRGAQIPKNYEIDLMAEKKWQEINFKKGKEGFFEGFRKGYVEYYAQFQKAF